MKLQSDPTIIYGLVGGKGTLGRPIMRSEIDQPTPYNTYVIEGLPPGPIANPGRASLEATANPARTKELFFVADGTRRPRVRREPAAASAERHQAAPVRAADPPDQRAAADRALGFSEPPAQAVADPVPAAPAPLRRRTPSRRPSRRPQ